MKPNDENKKRQRKKNQKDKPKSFFDDDKFYERKINKEFKYRKKYLSEDDENWMDWQNDDN